MHLIDGTQEDVVTAYKTIRGELEAYGHGLAEKHEILALNKVDAIADEDLAEKQAALEAASGQKVHLISAVAGKDVDKVLFDVLGQLDDAKDAEAQDALDEDAPWAP